MMFARYVGIDYSGAETPTSSLKGLRIYAATPGQPPQEVLPPPSPRKYWSRRGIFEWLARELETGPRTLVGIDHAFSFPLWYFHEHAVPLDWPAFLDDFHRHWPTDSDHMYVDFVLNGTSGNAAARSGDPRWRRLADVRARAKSPFHFHVQGSVAKSTHAGLPWLFHLRHRLECRVHFWPFDGWQIPEGKSVVAEAYPSLYRHAYAPEDRDQHQHDAYAIAAWMRDADRHGTLEQLFDPELNDADRRAASIEGWIIGLG